MAKIIFSKGDYRIGIYAYKDINVGEELFIDYDGDNNLSKDFPFFKQWKYTKN